MRTRPDLWQLAGCCGLALLLGVFPGQDANWDLRNYHFYNAYAWLHDRWDFDVAPAQLQSWLNPYWDLIHYALVRSGAPSWITTAVLALPSGVALFLLTKVAARLAPHHARGWALAAIVITGATAAGGMPVIGTTMSEWHIVALGLAAMWLVLAGHEQPRRNLMFFGLAGLCGGAATGWKLTASSYAVGLAVLVLALPGSPARRATRLAALSVGGLVGFLVVYGTWGWQLYSRFRNPFFPFFNDVFRSPLASALSYRDERFVAKSFEDIVMLPLRIARRNGGLVSELALRDARLAVGFVSLAFLAWCPHPLRAAERDRWRAIFAMYAVSFAIWASMFGILRYAGVLELMSAAAAVTAIAAILPRGRVWQLAGQLGIATALVASTDWPQWGRVPHGRPAVIAQVPSVPPHAMVVIATLEPVAYVVPSLPPEVPVIALVNNFELFQPRPPLQQAALERVRRYEGPLLLLASQGAANERVGGGSIFTMLARMGLLPAMDRCSPIHDGIGAGELLLCDLTKVPVESAVH